MDLVFIPQPWWPSLNVVGGCKARQSSPDDNDIDRLRTFHHFVFLFLTWQSFMRKWQIISFQSSRFEFEIRNLFCWQKFWSLDGLSKQSETNEYRTTILRQSVFQNNHSHMSAKGRHKSENKDSNNFVRNVYNNWLEYKNYKYNIFHNY